MSKENDMTPEERAWLHFLCANNPAWAPEPTVRLVRMLIRICGYCQRNLT